MDRRRRIEINRFADAVRDYVGLEGPPFDAAAAVAKLRGTLTQLPAAELPNAAEARVRKVGDGFEVIVGPAPAARLRFSIAHELGHLFLHMGYLVDSEKWSSCHEYVEMNRH